MLLTLIHICKSIHELQQHQLIPTGLPQQQPSSHLELGRRRRAVRQSRHKQAASAEVPPPNLSFTHQFAFRPTGSPAAAIICLLNTVTNLLLTNPHIIVISLDFIQQGVWHSARLHPDGEVSPAIPSKLRLQLADFFTGHSHCTVYHGQASTLKSVIASIIHGSGIGPAAYVVNASDLYKFADVIPATLRCCLSLSPASRHSRGSEIDNIDTWARTINLTLKNNAKEIVFSDRRRRCHHHRQRQILPVSRLSKF